MALQAATTASRDLALLHSLTSNGKVTPDSVSTISTIQKVNFFVPVCGTCQYFRLLRAGFPEDILHTFDAVVVDPPFITREVWEKYTISCKALLRVDPALRAGEEPSTAAAAASVADASLPADSKTADGEGEGSMSVPVALAEAAARVDAVIATTIHENAEFMHELLGVTPNKWQPSIPNLVYQYDLYTNYASQRFAEANPEIPSWDD